MNTEKPDRIRYGRYWIVRAPGHPLAFRTGVHRGYVYEHRKALYEALGRPDHSSCHWCGYVLPWKLHNDGTVSHDEVRKYVVNVDHIYSQNRDDNRPSNLRPSCWWCNTCRSLFPGKSTGDVAFRTMMLERYRGEHPANRPDEEEMITQNHRYWYHLQQDQDRDKKR